MFKKDFLRIKFDDKDDDSISHTLKAFNLINKLLEKTDDFYRYEFIGDINFEIVDSD